MCNEHQPYKDCDRALCNEHQAYKDCDRALKDFGSLLSLSSGGCSVTINQLRSSPTMGDVVLCVLLNWRWRCGL